ncbi:MULTISPECIES: acetyl-CoA C-acyltransferase [unclassified Mycobacterium]|uniref:thiolase family protein n=1 Tax=unclassified Mycobacterium TaxID=2642494 RepID=UPI00073FAE7B|nr:MULTISPECIES: acetyl-CoA C-acyltransferase [unclassified Mycobacterium]KUH83117.1 hypothetical protein AU185_04875 [Mycobacterium sp. GA-0227b]KUH84472.1 hypothetical protein AU186_21685 [Mycobacterium sp. GA-1999]KUH89392.1 hypothetical protein AU187_09740 [Mycobacterium sp. IS-1556]
MADVAIVSARRSAVGRRGGSLAKVHPTTLLGAVTLAALDEACVNPASVGQVIGGCIDQVGAQAANVTRMAWLAVGGPIHTPASTVHSACGSSQQAFNLAASLVAAGTEDVVVACGVELMSLIPLGSAILDGEAAGHGLPQSGGYDERYGQLDQFAAVEALADKYGVRREQADEYGLESQRRALIAIEERRFGHQIVPITVGSSTTAVFDTDEVPRNTDIATLSALNPVVNGGIHTAGTSSKIADAAAAVVLMNAERATAEGLTPLARVHSTSFVGCDPQIMLEGPIPVTADLLKKGGMTIDDIDIFEVNEAFAAVVLGWQKVTGADPARTNPNGGAIALGHALGSTGCVLITKAAHEMSRTGSETALVTMCCGGGLGTGTLLTA